jgi:CRP-like cAMP-binding protein
VSKLSTRIAVIGSNEFMEQVNSLRTELADIEIVPYIYQEPKEAISIVKNLIPCDIIFFSGALPYFFSKEVRELLPIPSLYIATDEMAVTTSLLSILYHNKIDLERLSIDIIDSSIVSNVLTELNLEPNLVHVLDYQSLLEGHFDLGKIVDYHQKLWTEGKIDLALTSIHAVYDRLHSLGIPAMRIANPRNSLIKGLMKAKSEAELFKSKAAQIAVGYISTKNQQDRIEEFAHKVQTSYQIIKEDLLVFYSTRGEMTPSSLQQLMDESESDMIVGFGYGTTLKEAEQHAHIALRFSEKDTTKKCGYLLTEEKELVGPFPQKQVKKQHSLKNDHPELLHIARQTKLSPANLSKIMEFSKSRSSRPFTAVELTNYLQVTRRSTERIIKKLVDNGYIKITGEEMTYHQGRPRAIYELTIPIYLSNLSN